MDVRGPGLLLLALGFLAFVAGYVEFGLWPEAVGSVLAGVGVLAAMRWPRALFLPAAVGLAWAIRFPLVGISPASTAAAYGLALGFAAMAVAGSAARPGRWLEAAGMALAGAANVWYYVDNAILHWTPGFAVGNILFMAGTAGVLAACWTGRAAPVAPVTAT